MKLHEVANLLGQAQGIVEAPKTQVTKYERDDNWYGGLTRISVTIQNGSYEVTVTIKKPKANGLELNNV